MIELHRNEHHMNGESVPVLEVWVNDALVVAVPLAERDEKIVIKDVDSSLEVIEMRLCEQGLVLKPNRMYVFTVDPDCDNCVNLERIGANHGNR